MLRGVAAGALAGVLAFLFTRIMVEPVIESSINYQTGRDAVEVTLRKAAGLAPNAPGPDIFSRAVQRNVGASLGLLVFGIALGALFAVLYTLAHRGYGDALSPRVLALLIAALGFLAIYMVPYLKYPANPPAIGHPDTINTRGQFYLAMVAISIVSVTAAVIAARRLTGRIGAWNAAIVALLGCVVWIAIVIAILPPIGHLHANRVQFGNFATETPQPLKNAHGQIVYPGFPADVLFKFRLYSVINQMILWVTIGLGFGYLAERMLTPVRRAAPASASGPSRA